MGQKPSFKKRPTQADVAHIAGVSQTTVSHVLNNTEIAIPVETRQRILDAIDELGYVPDRTARSLRTRKTYTLASIIPDITNPFYPAFQRGIQDVAEHNDYDLIIYNTDGTAPNERRYLRSLQHGRVDGAIVVPFHLDIGDLQSLTDMDISIVALVAEEQDVKNLPLDTLYIDNTSAAQTAVSYLIERGHSSIGMIAGVKETPPRRSRILGYRRALADHHLPMDEILIKGGDFTEHGGYTGMQELLKLSPLPSAVFAANDLMAIGAMNAIRQAGMRVPEDVALVGFDDIPAARLVDPRLTTITQFKNN